MSSSLVRGKYVIGRVIDNDRAEVIEDGAIFQRDGKIVEIGAEEDLSGRHQNPLKTVVKNVPRRPRHLRPGHHQLTLSLTLPSQRHPRLRKPSQPQRISQSRLRLPSISFRLP